jgi:hypothetical protein
MLRRFICAGAIVLSIAGAAAAQSSVAARNPI